jgi:hypothetical protein
MATLISLSLAAAVALFVLSLPFGGLAIGKTLRRGALLCFLVAFLPALLSGLVVGAGGIGRGSGVGVLEGIGLLTVLALGAYAVLAIRKRLQPGRDAWSQYVSQKSAGKQPLDADDGPDAGLW